MIQRVAPTAFSLLLLCAAGVIVGFSVKGKANATYVGLDVDVQEIKGMFFVDAAGVRDAILTNDSITGSWIEDISLQDVIQWVHSIPAVKEVEVYPGLDKILHVRVSQKEPVARLHKGPNQEDVYIDTEGEVLPLSPYFTARVPVIHAQTEALAHKAFGLIRTTRKHPLWSTFIDQIVVTSAGELEMIPRIGGARIALGDTTNLDTKLNNLLTFYRAQIERGNLNEYQRIDLAFKGQVVAKRYY